MVAQVRPSELNDWLASTAAAPGSAVLLDVREPWETQVASVAPGAFDVVKIPMGELVQRMGELDPDRPVACLCHHGARSMRVAMYLAQNGFTQVANVAGGIDLWSQEADSSVPRY